MGVKERQRWGTRRRDQKRGGAPSLRLVARAGTMPTRTFFSPLNPLRTRLWLPPFAKCAKDGELPFFSAHTSQKPGPPAQQTKVSALDQQAPQNRLNVQSGSVDAREIDVVVVEEKGQVASGEDDGVEGVTPQKSVRQGCELAVLLI